MRHLVLTFSLAVTVALIAGGCDRGSTDDEAAATDGPILVSGAWTRPVELLEGDADMDHDATAEEDMDMGGSNGAVYLEIRNIGEIDDRLIAVDADIAGAAELHTVNMVGDVMQMREIEGGITVPAGGTETVVLESGGQHVMLVGLHESLEPGDSFDIELEFEHAGVLEVPVEVREQ